MHSLRTLIIRFASSTNGLTSSRVPVRLTCVVMESPGERADEPRPRRPSPRDCLRLHHFIVELAASDGARRRLVRRPHRESEARRAPEEERQRWQRRRQQRASQGRRLLEEQRWGRQCRWRRWWWPRREQWRVL
jgi:hypothetical protein